MAYKVVWSPEALDDIQATADYISKNSPFYAAAVVRKIVALTRQIALFPYSGRIVPELDNDAIRERTAHSYRIIYQVGTDVIIVVAIVHSKRLLSPDIQP